MAHAQSVIQQPGYRTGWLPGWLASLQLERQNGNTWTCRDCYCAFYPEPAKHGRVAVSRYRYRDGRDGCFIDKFECYCHRIPEEIPRGAGTITWLSPLTQPAARDPWACRRDSVSPVSCDAEFCAEDAIAYINLWCNYLLIGWVCGTHLGVQAPAFRLNSGSSEPKEFREAREHAEVLLALMPGIHAYDW